MTVQDPEKELEVVTQHRCAGQCGGTEDADTCVWTWLHGGPGAAEGLVYVMAELHEKGDDQYEGDYYLSGQHCHEADEVQLVQRPLHLGGLEAEDRGTVTP